MFTNWDLEHDAAEVVVRSVEDTLARRETLVQSIRGLDQISRKLLKLKYVDGKTSQEIGRIVRQSPTAVRMRIMRLLERLRHSLRRAVDRPIAVDVPR